MTPSRTSLPGTTWFLRDQAELDVLVAALARDHARSRSLCIWSIGCSTGQEPYSLTMALLDAGLKPLVLGTDVRQEALDTAQAARYSMRVAAALPVAWRQRYASVASSDEIVLRSSVTSRVSFQLHDVAQLPELPRGWGTFDAVLCRNVLIYFDRAEAVEVVKRIADVCRPGGYLLLSAAERPLAWASASWTQDEDYKDSALLRRAHAAMMDPARQRSGQSAPPSIPPRAPGVPSSHAAQRGTSASIPPRAPGVPSSHAAQRGTSASIPPRAPVTPSGPADPSAGAAAVTHAASLLHRGDAAGALAVLDDLLVRDPLQATGHLLRGMALKHLGRIPEATGALRSARLLLHDAAWMPPYQLGLLLEQLGDQTEAAEAYRHTLTAIRAGARSGMPDVEHEDALRATVVDTCQLRLRRLTGASGPL